jgi:hypothetical protein
VAFDGEGNAYVGGTTYSLDFPVLRAFQPSKGYTASGHEAVNNAFIAKLAPSGASLVYSSYLGGSSCATLGGCNADGDDDSALAIAVDGAGFAYLAGQARSVNFPQVEPIQGLPNTYNPSIPFVAKVQDRPGGAALLYSVGLGRKDSPLADGAASAIAVDGAGTAHVTGYIANAFPTTPGALSSASSSNTRVVIFKLAPGAFPTTLSVSNAQPTSADTVTLTATVTGGVPGGQVTFYDNGNSIATVSVSGGIAEHTASFPAGVREITAVYSGDNKPSRPLFLPVKQATN